VVESLGRRLEEKEEGEKALITEVEKLKEENQP